MFTELPSGSYLGKHRDPYAGSVRYHLGLVTPNSDDCFIEVDQERYSWRDGVKPPFLMKPMCIGRITRLIKPVLSCSVTSNVQ
jgi:aspartyl/asparaginyl beta-hydroxylase (cupin superfamily)